MCDLLKITLALRKDSTVTIKQDLEPPRLMYLMSFNQEEDEQVIQMAPQESQTQLAKRRRKINYNQDPEEPAAKQPCQCSKVNCSKEYCSCFHNGRYCSDECKCLNCENREHSHRPAKKMKMRFMDEQERVCNCVRSQCLKNYCECFIRGQKCSSHCKCKNCGNKRKYIKKTTP